MSRNEEYSRLRLQTLPLPPLDPFLSSEHFVARVTIKLFFAQVWRSHGAKSPDPPLDFPTWLQPAPSATGYRGRPLFSRSADKISARAMLITCSAGAALTYILMPRRARQLRARSSRAVAACCFYPGFGAACCWLFWQPQAALGSSESAAR